MDGLLRFPGNLIAAIGALLAAIPLYLFDPAESAFFPPCPSHALTGLYCPGCGSTRALHALLHGDFQHAATMNVAIPVMLPVIILLIVKPQLRYNRWISLAVLIGFVTYAILRNIPAYPFTLLAPH